MVMARQDKSADWRTIRYGWLVLIGSVLLVVVTYIYTSQMLPLENRISLKQNRFNSLFRSESDISDRPSGKFVHIFDDDTSEINASCIDYKMLKPLEGVTKLCVHNSTEDSLVSGMFLKGMYWEKNHLIPIGQILKSNPEMVFMDIGSHVGMYTMYANKAGNPVIAIDPLKKNVCLLRKSVQLVNQEDNVMILWNAVSNKHEKLYLEEGQPNNIGSTHLVASGKKVNKKLQAAPYRIQTIMLDDLLEVFDLDKKKVMMKMDIEGFEWKALQGGYAFFRRVNVCYLMVEFFGHKATPLGPKIVKFMLSHNLFPYKDFGFYQNLPLNDTKDYPLDTVFAKNTTECAGTVFI